MSKLRDLLFGTSSTPTPAPASNDFEARLNAMNANAANARTTEHAIAVMQESASITNDLYKSFSAAKPEVKEEAPAKSEDETPASAAKEDETPAANADEGDEPTSDNPDDADLMADAPPSDAPAAAPEAITAASGKEGEGAPVGEEPAGDAKLGKSVSEIMADHVPTSEGTEEPLFDASQLVTELLKSIGATQEREAQNATSLETVLEYQEQLGAMLTKSIEGQQIIYDRQSEIFERLGGIEAAQTQSQESYAQQVADLNKSLNGALEGVGQYVQGLQRQPQGTPTGRAPLAGNSVPSLALTDAVPAAEETHNGWTRTTLKKSIEGHIRSDRCEKSGITTADFLSIGKVANLADLDPKIFQVAEAESKLGTGS